MALIFFWDIIFEYFYENKVILPLYEKGISNYHIVYCR